jgi:hypothetical protein
LSCPLDVEPSRLQGIHAPTGRRLQHRDPLVILGFMALYLVNSQFFGPHLSWNEALVLSVSSFHGRGFFNPNIALGDTYAQLAAAEALLGTFIEIIFIATFTQRFFAR